MSNCHFLSLNVRGLRNKEKRSQIFRWFRHQKGHIFFVQETYWTADIENIVKSEWRGPCYFSHGTNHSKGVAILFDEHLDIDVTSIEQSDDGRKLLLKVKMGTFLLTMVNVYAPTKKKQRERFF